MGGNDTGSVDPVLITKGLCKGVAADSGETKPTEGRYVPLTSCAHSPVSLEDDERLLTLDSRLWSNANGLSEL